MKLRNNKILVFGGGSGIGKAIAKRFCDAGAKVLIAGRNEKKLKDAAYLTIHGTVEYTFLVSHHNLFTRTTG